jgi:serine/threonine protein kinase
MRYLTNSPIRCHGNLKSRNCIVDSRWVLKVTDYHLNEVYSLQNSPRQVDINGLNKLQSHKKKTGIHFILDLLWMSPEHIRTSIIKNDVATVMTSSSAGDVYSFGIIMQEVILRGPPFCMLDLTPQGRFLLIDKTKSSSLFFFSRNYCENKKTTTITKTIRFQTSRTTGIYQFNETMLGRTSRNTSII